MVDDVDELAILILNTAGRSEAIALYQEETGCSHAESVQAVENMIHRVGIGRKTPFAKRLGMVGLAIAAIGILALRLFF